jgi:glycosyltransferase involved in cell wall biosynthesis
MAANVLREIVVYDSTCFAPYDHKTMASRSIGGAQSTVVHVSKALGIPVVQHNRKESEGAFVAPADMGEPKTIIVLRSPKTLEMLGARFPQARLILWCHDLLDHGSKRARSLVKKLQRIERHVQIVGVSDFHKRQIEDTLERAGIGDSKASVTRIYNPISPLCDSIAETPGTKDPSKLIFFSSPHKGLSFALKAFRYIQKKSPELKLYVANPGYRNREWRDAPNVHDLGSLKPSEVLEHVKDAALVFCPNFVHPETFGLVFIEANRLNTPVLTHSVGAAGEVLSEGNALLPIPPILQGIHRASQHFPKAARLMDVLLPDALKYEPYRLALGRLLAAPKSVEMKDTFKLDRIVLEWQRLLG